MSDTNEASSGDTGDAILICESALLQEGGKGVRFPVTAGGEDTTGFVVRYAGQAHEITTPIAAGEPDFSRLARDFGDEHERTYGHQAQAEEVECVALRVVARLPVERRPGNTTARRASPSGKRDAYFGPQQGSTPTSVVSRAELAAPKQGPLIVEEYDSTCVVPPGWSAALDAQGNLVLSHEKR
jgi:N-methylhydantoinase A